MIIKDEQLLINSIMTNLLQSPIVVDSVSKAISIAKKYLEPVKRNYDLTDNIYLHSLRVGLRVAEHTLKTSNSPLLYNYANVIIAILHDVIEDADCEELRNDLEIFRTADNKILNGILALTNEKDLEESFGRSKYMCLKFSNLSSDMDLFLIKIIDRTDNLKCFDLIKDTDEYREDPVKGDLFRDKYFLETFSIYNNLKLSNTVVRDDVYPYYNDLVTMLLTTHKF